MSTEDHNTETPLLDEPSPACTAEGDVPREVHPLWWPTRWWLVMTGLVAPISCCLLLSLADTPAYQADTVEYQMDHSTTWSEHAGTLLIHPSSIIWLPCVTFAVVCMGCFLANPVVVRRRFFCRLAIYTGFLLAAYYWVLLTVSFFAWAIRLGFTELVLMMTVAPLPFGLALWLLFVGVHLVGTRVIFRLRGSFSVSREARVVLTFLFILTPAILLASIFSLSPTFVMRATGPLVESLPMWTLLTYGGVSIHLFYHAWKDAKGQFSLTRLFIVTAWLAGLLALWRITVIWTFST